MCLYVFMNFMNEEKREQICPTIKSHLGYRMYSEGIEVLPGCDKNDPLLESYEILVKEVAPVIIEMVNFGCLKDENDNFCPLFVENNTADIENACKSKLCRESTIKYLNLIIEKKNLIKTLNPNSYNEMNYSNIEEIVKQMNSEECHNGTLEIKKENNDNGNNNNKGNKGNYIKYIIIGSIGTVVIGI
ncbi:hypothetical protein PIROE2DRAFT_17073 [Piromyces sp. E2]|nr:hypothetical protein PIROE2DRAFT_17073 [Piromyces sp. E2]|eukprot:OUM57815.1 hypothetical protein PIROE2DRAFT_17073 [Piromyces sp. E2]